MANENGYNGWANWDTWNAALWLTNDEGAYRAMQRAAHLDVVRFEEAAVEELEELGNRDGIDYTKVDWDEVQTDAFGEE